MERIEELLDAGSNSMKIASSINASAFRQLDRASPVTASHQPDMMLIDQTGPNSELTRKRLSNLSLSILKTCMDQHHHHQPRVKSESCGAGYKTIRQKADVDEHFFRVLGAAGRHSDKNVTGSKNTRRMLDEESCEKAIEEHFTKSLARSKQTAKQQQPQQEPAKATSFKPKKNWLTQYDNSSSTSSSCSPVISHQQPQLVQQDDKSRLSPTWSDLSGGYYSKSPASLLEHHNQTSSLDNIRHQSAPYPYQQSSPGQPHSCEDEAARKRSATVDTNCSPLATLKRSRSMADTTASPQHLLLVVDSDLQQQQQQQQQLQLQQQLMMMRNSQSSNLGLVQRFLQLNGNSGNLV